MKIDNGTGGSRETSTGKPARVDERGRESINLFAELKRRNVYKVGIAYIVAGWALSQGIAQVFPVFDIPNWIIRLIVLLIILTFTWPYLDLHCYRSRCILHRLVLSGSLQCGK